MKLFDNIHGYIEIDPIAQSIINTPVFQRLREIHQTGVLYLVFPTANHSRFEHSIGTYHLAKKMITNIAKTQPDLFQSELIAEEIIIIVSIAALCHDLGHLLFSHLFDDLFLPTLPNYKTLLEQTNNIYHEARSIYLLEYIVETYKVNISKPQLFIISDLIYPSRSEYAKWESKYRVGKWIFQIVSNPINSVDVDKFDYLTRDTRAVGLKIGFNYDRIISDARIIDNKICYSTQSADDLYQMFFIRYRLHRQIYNHKTVKSIEILILKILSELESSYSISETITDPDKMIKLCDSFIWESAHPYPSQLHQDLLMQIHTRKIPKLVYESISTSEVEFDEDKLLDVFPKDSYKIIRFKVGYIGGSGTNPLNRITFYNTKSNQIVSENKVKNFSLFLNQKFQEYFLRVYCTNLTLIDQFKEYFEKI
jgi:HD superfamily phosphohydrolase